MILGCDPGLSGAFAMGDDIEDMPTYTETVNGKERRRIDAPSIFRLVEDYRDAGAVVLVIEDVKGAPGQSAPAAFAFGYGVGLVIGAAMAHGLQIERVAPAVWKRALRVPSDKRASRARASELLPHLSHFWPLAKHDGRAEAAMIALYFERRT